MTEDPGEYTVAAVALDAHDPDTAARELNMQLATIVIKHLESRLFKDETPASPEEFADALATATSKVVVIAFHVGRSWQSQSEQHQRIHDLEHGGANN